VNELRPTHRHVLGLAVEDCYGLFELLHDDPVAPDELTQSSDRRALLEDFHTQMLDAMLIEVKFRSSSVDDLVGVTANEARMLVAAESSSQVPGQHSFIVVIGATPLGERLSYSLERVNGSPDA
jgi:hypothetical protein